MESNQILQSDVLDIIFENRNKSYGAYILRKEYDNRLIKSLMIMMAMVGLVAFLVSRNTLNSNIRPALNIETVLYKMAQPATPPKKTEQPKSVAASSKKVSAQTFVTHVAIVNNRDSATHMVKNLDSAMIASHTGEGPAGAVPLVKQPLDITVGRPGGGENVIKTGNNNVEMIADVMPVFPGGADALRRFLERNLTTPSELEQGEMIEVKVQFIVGYDGHLKGFHVVQDGGEVFNNEVIRVLKKMPDWVPGKTKGENVSVYYTIPVKFMADSQ